jgi:glycosyltransferase involved in cell wall biosynthesis
MIVHHYASKYNVPYIIQAHGSIPRIDKKFRKLLYDFTFGYRVLNKASKVIALSKVEAEQYRSMSVPKEKIAIIPNGIDLSEYTNLPSRGTFKKKFGIPEDTKVILYLGRIHRSKGIDFLVKTYAYLIDKMGCRDAILVIAGPDDGYLNELKSLVRSTGLDDKVLFTGMLSEKDKINAYVDATICVYLSPYEPFGLVSLEAAACCKPIIVAEGTFLSEIVNQHGFGFSVRYGDFYKLAEIIHEIFTNDNLLITMGQKGREYVFKNCSWATLVAKLVKIYEEVRK